jgi:hypothetical protein
LILKRKSIFLHAPLGIESAGIKRVIGESALYFQHNSRATLAEIYPGCGAAWIKIQDTIFSANCDEQNQPADQSNG